MPNQNAVAGGTGGGAAAGGAGGAGGASGSSSRRAGSIGAHRVREDFNPGGNEMVNKIKRYTADLIDLCEDLKDKDPRLAAHAQTIYEDAAMWAVKAATA